LLRSRTAGCEQPFGLEGQSLLAAWTSKAGVRHENQNFVGAPACRILCEVMLETLESFDHAIPYAFDI